MGRARDRRSPMRRGRDGGDAGTRQLSPPLSRFQLMARSAKLGGADRAVSRCGEQPPLERRPRRRSPLAVELGDTGALRWCLAMGLCVLLCATCTTGDPDRYSQVKETHNGTYLSQYEWRVRDMYALLQRSSVMHGVNLAGPDFYTGKPGYRVRLGLSFGRINPANGIPYMGVWFTILRGRYDDALEWPFQYRFNITVVDPSGSGQDSHVSMNPMTAICRLRKQFQRPTERRTDGVEGCGKSFLIPHSKLLGYVADDSLLMRLSIFLEDKGAIPKRAKAYMRGHQLVSEFQWAVDDIDAKIKQARKGELQPLTSDLFYINSESYLMVLQLTFHPEDEHLGLFAVVIPGEFDDSLEWPLSYSFELSIVDQSAGFLTADRKGVIDPTSGVCPLNAFTKPQLQPNTPCGFRKLVSFSALERSNFKKDGKILLRFTAILDQMPNFASVSVKDRHLVAEYVWKVPNVERKIALAISGRPSNLLSERFYTRHQGYLMQMQLKFQNYTNGSIGAFLTLLEGGYDSLAQWPFVKRFDLIIIDQQHGKRGDDVVVAVDPNNPYIKNEACVGSFWRPFGRNDACGSSSAISYDEVYNRKYIRYGSLLVKVVVYMEEIEPPNMARLVFRDDSVVAEYDWLVPNIKEKVAQAKLGNAQFADSDKFYLTNGGYRVMLRLYPEKASGYVGLYVVFTRGAYDDVLEWPFTHKYEMVIADQKDDSSADIVHTTFAASGCPDIALQKPAQELAEWSCGESRMASHAALLNGGYVRDGAIRVRFRVFLKEYASHVASVAVRNNALVSEYLWELKDAPAKLNLLKNGGFAKVESPIFYTGNQGYALRMSLVLNKVTTPLQTLASNDDQSVLGIYFTLWKGRHDGVLKWPFPHVITLAVVDTARGRADLSKTVDPTHARCPPEAFHKPKSMRNEHACGFSAFMAVERLGDYMRDGSLVIRATIDMRS
ncbi:uncharacterized protein [Dermacentor andersoni]|uniref:uncharacterized protein n=1 Tax=Dermacentor andersoni TaxID=34620 RepID=UPI0021551E93|nr:uncharacterized protein LOC126531654 [Dermacentor andersoni]